MNRFLKNLVTDLLVIYPIIAFAVMGNEYAENALSFLGITLLVTMLVGVFTIDDIAKKKIEKDEPVKTKYHVWYTNSAGLLKILAIASMGWYWVAAGFLVAVGYAGMLDDKHRKLLNRD